MANYQESTVNGAKWLRAKQVVVENEYGQMPSIAFTEEEVMQIAGETSVIKLTTPSNPRPPLVEMFSNPDEVMQLLDPDTDAVVGAAKYSEIRQMLYSLYRHVAAKRDSGVPGYGTPVYQEPPPQP